MLSFNNYLKNSSYNEIIDILYKSSTKDCCGLTVCSKYELEGSGAFTDSVKVASFR